MSTRSNKKKIATSEEPATKPVRRKKTTTADADDDDNSYISHVVLKDADADKTTTVLGFILIVALIGWAVFVAGPSLLLATQGLFGRASDWLPGNLVSYLFARS